MKKTTLLTITAMAVAFGLNACTNAEVASMKQGINDAGNNSYENKNNSVQSNKIDKDLAMEAVIACRDYITTKTNLPYAAVSVVGPKDVYGDNTKVYVPATVKWDDPLVDERGECLYTGGQAVKYKIFP